jgi:membrane protease subunit HflC
MPRRVIYTIAFIGGLLILASQCLFTVHQTQKALILQLGEPMRGIYDPGLHFKLPFVQNVIYFDARILDYEARKADTLTSDKKTIVLDNYARWRIIDPLLFHQTVRTTVGAKARLVDIIYSQLRAKVGSFTMTEVITEKRSEIMRVVTESSSAQARAFGIEVVDVRIKRTDLPPQNQQAIFGRMQTEREREALRYRSEGQEEALKIRSTAERERTILLAEAQRRALVLHGEGEAQAVAIFAESLSQAPEFYEFQKSLEVYKSGLQENTRVLFPLDSPLFRYFSPRALQ